MKKIVVTGATSLIGTALIDVCIQNKVEVLGIIQPNSKNRRELPFSPYLKIVEHDLKDIGSLAKHVSGIHDVFYHFAWMGTSREEREKINIQFQNMEYTLDAVTAASVLGCSRFIGAGSQAEYGNANRKLSPFSCLDPKDAYGAAKLSAGYLSKVKCEELNLDHIWGRIFSVYGPHDNKNTLINYLIEELLHNNSPNLTKCEQNWDYLFSRDAGEAFFLMGTKGKPGSVYCVGSGKTLPLFEYIDIIVSMIGKEIKPKFGVLKYSENQVMCLCADIETLTKDTGFIPKTSFEIGIKKTIQWHINKDK